jgi:hypothetical protein
VYNQLQLKLVDGKTASIQVEPTFRVQDLQYDPKRRAVSLGNLTVLYHGLVYDVHPKKAG